MHGCVCRLEGPRCDIDINECVRGTDNCASNAACINTKGIHACFPPCHVSSRVYEQQSNNAAVAVYESLCVSLGEGDTTTHPSHPPPTSLCPTPTHTCIAVYDIMCTTLKGGCHLRPLPPSPQWTCIKTYTWCTDHPSAGLSVIQKPCNILKCDVAW